MSRFFLLAGLLAVLLLLVVTAMGMTDWLDRKFVFFPTAAIERTPADVGLKFEDVYFPTDDGLTLNGWFVPAPPTAGEAAGRVAGTTLLWFHGNGGNLGHRVDDLAFLSRRLGGNLFIFDYRGYGSSQGRPSETGVYRDARAALNYLSSRPDVDPERIVFLSRSLGTAVAVELAANYQRPSGIILVSPLTSLGDMARFLHPYLPMHWLAGDRFNSLARISDVSSPLLIIHSEVDETVPVEQGRRLFQAANPPKEFLALTNAGHNDNLAQDGAAIEEALDNFLASLEP